MGWDITKTTTTTTTTTYATPIMLGIGQNGIVSYDGNSSNAGYFVIDKSSSATSIYMKSRTSSSAGGGLAFNGYRIYRTALFSATKAYALPELYFAGRVTIGTSSSSTSFASYYVCEYGMTVSATMDTSSYPVITISAEYVRLSGTTLVVPVLIPETIEVPFIVATPTKSSGVVSFDFRLINITTGKDFTPSTTRYVKVFCYLCYNSTTITLPV